MLAHLRFSRNDWPAFQVCGVAGLCLGAAFAATLTSRLGLSLAVLTAILFTTGIVFFALAMAMKVVTGRERLVYYYHEIAVLSAAALLLYLLQRPIFSYLDVTALGVGLFLACGRIGCFLVGCCHGRPLAGGVVYSAGHALAGFPSHLVGVPLVPVQVIESACVLGIVAIGAAVALAGPPGAALAWYLMAYGTVRFALEFLRGDARPYWFGLSEAQWISLASIGLVTASRAHGPLVVIMFAVVALLGLAYARCGFGSRVRVPAHLDEVAQAAQDALWAAPRGIRVATTSLGIRVSAGIVRNHDGAIYHFAFSRAKRGLSENAARRMAESITQTWQLSAVCLLRGRGGVFHLLARERFLTGGQEITRPKAQQWGGPVDSYSVPRF